MQQHHVYREQAAKARADAEAATLDNVRERCLRAEAAFTAMAERLERIGRAREIREAKGDAPTSIQETT